MRWLPLVVVISLTACKRDDIKVYYAPKDTASTPEMTASANPGPDMGGAMPPGHPEAGAAQPQLGFTTPVGWTQMPASEFRLASFSAKNADGKTADVSVVPLPGDAGGDAPNVNRWRGQVGLTALSPEDLAKAAQTVDVGGQPGSLYEQTGTNPGSGEPMGVISVIQHRDGISWFFKMTGEPGMLAEQKPVFLDFLKTLKFATGQPAGLPEGHPAMGGSMPPGHTEMGMTPAPANGPISHEGQPTWQIPTGWQEVSGGQFLIAKFMITDESGTQAAVNVSTSPNDGGGLAANVARWRGQLGLPPLSADELTKAVTDIDVAGGKGSLVEMSGKDARTGNPAMLTGVIVAQPGQTWFYKLMGPSAIVMAEKNTFLKFVQTVKY